MNLPGTHTVPRGPPSTLSTLAQFPRGFLGSWMVLSSVIFPRWIHFFLPDSARFRRLLLRPAYLTWFYIEHVVSVRILFGVLLLSILLLSSKFSVAQGLRGLSCEFCWFFFPRWPCLSSCNPSSSPNVSLSTNTRQVEWNIMWYIVGSQRTRRVGYYN